MLSEFYKNDPKDRIWWVDRLDDNMEPVKGEFLFSFDKKKIYNLFQDYPHGMTEEEVKIFNKENPSWKEFFKERTN